MYREDHAPPHFHAFHAGTNAAFRIDPLGVIIGRLSPPAHSSVLEWAARHQDELRRNWERAQAHRPLVPIAPLD